MKHFFTFLFLLILFVFTPFGAISNNITAGFFNIEKATSSNFNSPAIVINATITGTDSVCVNSPAPNITFTGSGGTAPYAFTYKINGGPDVTIFTTSGDNVILPAPTNVTGQYIYTLTNVSDASNQQTALNQSVTITVGALPDVTLISSESIGTVNGTGFEYCSENTDIIFANGSITAGTNKSYLVNWGDGTSDFSTSSWTSTSHIYAPGLWTLTYSITGESGCTLTKKYIILINSEPKVSFGTDNTSKNLCIGEDFTCLISYTQSNLNNTTYTLTYSDGTPPIIYDSIPPTRVTHTFNTSSCGHTCVTSTGTYLNSFSATIEASNLCYKSVVTVGPIYVSTPPVANFTFVSPKICLNALAFFTDASTGSEVTGLDPTCKLPKRMWKITPSFGVTLNSGVYGNDSVNSNPTNWISGSTTISPIFTKPGKYTIKLIVGNRCGIDEKDTIITVEPALLPRFTLDGTQGCTPFQVKATNTTDFTNNPSVACLWEVGYSPGNCGAAPATWTSTNTTNKDSLNPSFNFVTPGSYTITLSLFNSCGIVKTSQTVQVTKPPTVIINTIGNSCDVASISPKALVEGCAPTATGLNYVWSFPGGIPDSSSLVIPGTINYSSPGTYTVSLKVTNTDCETATTAIKTFTVNKTPTVNDIPNQEVCNGSSTASSKFSGIVPNTTYNWTISNPTIGLTTVTGKDSIPQFVAVNNTAAQLTATVTVTPVANGCTGTAKTFTIIVNPSPAVIFSAANQVICSEDTTNMVTLTSPTASGVTFNWSAQVPGGIKGLTILTGTNTIPVQKLINTTYVPLVVTYIAYASFLGADTCKGVDFKYTITVNPKASIPVDSFTTICSGNPFTITPVNGNGNIIPAGTIYTWTNPVSNPTGVITGGSEQITAKPFISQILTNISSVVATATYTVTPLSGNCAGQSFDIIVSVKPTPIVNQVNDTTLCAGVQYVQPDFTGNFSMIVYDWTSDNTGIGILSSGTGTIPSFITSNLSTLPVKAKITVTPTANGCSGVPKSFYITVNPVCKVNPIADIIVCPNQLTALIAFTSNTLNTTFEWTNDSSSIGLPVSGSGYILPFTAINNGTIPLKATITVIPTTKGCKGVSSTFSIKVNPEIIVNDIANQEVCDSAQTAEVIFSGNIINTIYNWRSSNFTIGLAANGTGNITGFNAFNATPFPISDTITVTPYANGCNGTPKTFIIKVNPLPVVNFSQINQTICSGMSSAVVNLSNPLPGITFSWTAFQSTGISGVIASGTTQIPQQILINTSILPIDVIYAAKAFYSSGIGCEGPTCFYKITVTPVSSISSQSSTICSGTAFSVLPEDGNGNVVLGKTQYTWDIPVISPSGSITGVSLQNTPHDSISQTLMNTIDSIATATYTVTPVSDNCNGQPFKITVSVSPAPTVNAIKDTTLCPGERYSQLNGFSGSVAGTVYNWTSSNDSIGNAMSGTGSIPSFTTINTTTIPIRTRITVTPTANGCIGISKSFNITVNPIPGVNPVQNDILCNNQSNGIISLTGNVPGTIFSWVNSNTTIGLKDSVGGNIPAFTTVNKGIAPAIDSITVTPIANGCTGIPYTFIRIVNPTPTVEQPVDQEVCNGFPFAGIKFSGNVANTTFNWTNRNSSIGLTDANGTDSISGFKAINSGTNQLSDTITVTPVLKGCSGIPKIFILKVNPTPQVVFSKFNQTICSGLSTSAVNLTNNVAGSSFVWIAVQPAGITGVTTTGTNQIPSQQLFNTTNLPIDVIYSAKAVYNSGISCYGNESLYTITVNPVTSLTNQEISICNGGTFGVLPKGGNGNIITLNTGYTWSAPVLNPLKSITGSSSQPVTQDSVSQTLTNRTNQPATATYTVTPISETCNGKPFTVVVTVNPTPDILFSLPNQVMNSGKTSIPVITSFTTGNIKYNWTVDVPSGITGQIKPTTNEIPAQTLVNLTNKKLTVIYTVTTVFDDESTCVGTTSSYIITVNPPLTTSYITSNYNGYNINVADGKDGWIDITVGGGSGTYTYSWTSSNGLTASTQDIDNLPAGDYTVVIKDGCCDSVILKFTMTEPVPFTVNENHVNNLCHGDSNGMIKIVITKESVGPYDFLLEKSGTTIKKVTGVAIVNYEFTGLYPGSYLITVKDAHGFTRILKDTITEPAALVASMTSQNNVVCFGENTGSATVKASGGTGKLSYTWLNTFPVQTTAKAAGLAAGTYSVLITDSVGCTVTDTITITQPEAPLKSSITAFENPTCSRPNLGSATVTVTGGTAPYNYLWNTIPEQITGTAANLTEGNYKVIITDAHGCVSYSMVTLIQPSGMTLSVKSHTNISCAGDSTGSVSIDVSGGSPFESTPGVYVYDYLWSGPNGFKSQLKDLNNLSAGIYLLTVTDNLGCSKIVQVTITEPEKLILTTTTTPVTCFGSNNASIKTGISGGVKPYKIIWSNSGNGNFQDNLSPGEYSVSVIDSMGCQKSQKISIPDAYFSYHPVITPVSCFGANDGTINLNILGGVPPISIVWTDNPAAGNVRNRLGPGTYTVSLKDGSSCSFTESYVILEPLKLKLSASITDALNCNISNSGAINLLVSGGTSPYVYQWSNGATTDIIDHVDAGNYSVTVTDTKGCSATESFLVKRQLPVSIDVTTSTNFDCVSKIVTQQCKAEIAGGVPPYQLKWSSGNVSGLNNEIMETTQSGMVLLQVVDGMGCTASNSFNVEIRNPGIKYQLVECNKFAFQFNAVVPNENENYTYSWDFGDGGISTQQNVQHIYTTTGSFTVRLILKSPSCTSYYSQVVTVEPGPMLSIDKDPQFCTGDSVVIHVKGADKYKWNDNSVSDSIVIRHTGQYIVSGTSNSGCTSTLSFTASHFDFSDYTIQTDRTEVTSDNIPLHLWSENIEGSQYYWDFGDGKTDQGNDLTHIFDITRDGYYDVKLKIINSHGCVQYVTKRIWITLNAVPNTFTPNGKNDVFMKNLQIQVYNRNGILFYEGKNGWDGTRNGRPVSNDTYFYVLFYSTQTGSNTKTGFVTVVR